MRMACEVPKGRARWAGVGGGLLVPLGLLLSHLVRQLDNLLQLPFSVPPTASVAKALLHDNLHGVKIPKTHTCDGEARQVRDQLLDLQELDGTGGQWRSGAVGDKATQTSR